MGANVSQAVVQDAIDSIREGRLPKQEPVEKFKLLEQERGLELKLDCVSVLNGRLNIKTQLMQSSKDGSYQAHVIIGDNVHIVPLNGREYQRDYQRVVQKLERGEYDLELNSTGRLNLRLR